MSNHTRVTKSRLYLHLAILVFPTIPLAILQWLKPPAPLNTHSYTELLWIFAFVLQWAAWLIPGFFISGVTLAQLFIKKENIAKLTILALMWSLLLRVVIGLFMLIMMCFLSQDSVIALTHNITDRFNIFPCTGARFVYLFCKVILSAFLEELWRASLFAGLFMINTSLFESLAKVCVSAIMLAVPFSLLHVYQGALGIAANLISGCAFALILVMRRSYFEAATTHALFNMFALTAIINVSHRP